MEYEAVIGLEVHVQLKTKSKAFSRSANAYGVEPNTLTDPVIMGLPGALPVMNLEAIQQTIRAGMMLNCRIADFCQWDRKNYFYPDNPKNYQISQQYAPICLGGEVEIELPGPARNIQGTHRKVKLNRIHLEEDAGKLTHEGKISLVDFNRAGTPLAEIVSEPDLFSSEEVVAYLNSLKMHMEYAGISDCDMEKGQMRCDVNVSIRPKGSSTFGTRVELKNLNSISAAKNAVDYEIKRQKEILEDGGKIVQETRRWNADRNLSESMRGKEVAADYCYFPEPDLMPVKPTKELLDSIREALPERPFDKQRRFMEQYQLPYTITSVLCPDATLSAYFESAVAHHSSPKAIANLIINDLLREISLNGDSKTDYRISPESLAELVAFIEKGAISKQAAQNVLVEMYASGGAVKEVIEKLGFSAEDNGPDLEPICQKVIAENPKPVSEYRAGKLTAINALKGRVMKETSGKANPAKVDEILKRLLA